jgi:hypothetical protein
MNTSYSYPSLLFVTFLGLVSCGREAQAPPLFNKLTPDQTGITFANTITTNDSVNFQTHTVLYNGGGVAIGDIDNDGLPDIFFTGNMVSSRLYRNKGNMEFEDITESAGVMTDRWASGATMADLDNNGYLDIYVSVSGPEWSHVEQRANLLFLNNGDRTFTEAAAAYRIDDTGFTTHAVFLDYDRDGYLDLFLLGNSPEEFARGEATRRPPGIKSQSSASYDELYRNNGDGTFTNVSSEAGILKELGFGLGVAVSDLNQDGWPDIYVSNDVTPSDVLYVNNGDGTFTDKAARWLKHTSLSGMGVDIADFNNDGWPDILQTDMMPEDLSSRKQNSGSMTYDRFVELRQRGYHYDYNVNTLQLNGGVTRDGDVIFSDVSRLAGVAYTDWSWTALFGDYDNDGYKDIFITNGFPKAVTDFDYQTAMLGIRRMGDREASKRRALEILEKLHSYELPNYMFRNEGDLTFSNKTKQWGMDHPGFSYGAAHGDLNNDGRLDIVVNNLNAPAFIYENVQSADDTTHYLQIVLEGEHPNRRGIGSTLVLVARGQKQHIYHSPYRGYVSTMDDRVHFGLGRAGRVDSLEVIWPDGRSQLLTDLEVDRIVTVRQEDAKEKAERRPSSRTPNHVFQQMNPGRGLQYEHREKGFVDYSLQPLLPYMVSRQGPPLAVGDVTGNGLDDVFIGGAAGFPGTLFLQREDGSFVEFTGRQAWEVDEHHDDWGALFFDADGDGLLDLYVASGGYRSSGSELQDRLYINQGGGKFAKDAQALPNMPTSTARVAAGDFTGDGRLDLFIGGRLAPRNCPYPTRSYVLRNDGGTFTDITVEAAPELLDPGGMITAAIWVDFTGDGRLDLVTAGEWMPVQFYAHDGARLRDVTRAMGLPPMRGWWYSLATGDFNNDGHVDLVAGNLGLNYSFTTSEESRFGVYAADITRNLTTDILFTQEIDGTEYPVYGLATLGGSIYTLDIQFPTYESFSEVPVRQIFTSSQLTEAVHYQVDTFASLYLQNGGDGTFTSFGLPNLAQISPIRGIIAHDVDRNGTLDLIVAGNLYHADPNTPRADAGNGLWLEGNGRGSFAPVPSFESGFLAHLDVTGLALLDTPAGKTILVANNADSLQAFTIRSR